jgi:hypothetical protein
MSFSTTLVSSRVALALRLGVGFVPELFPPIHPSDEAQKQLRLARVLSLRLEDFAPGVRPAAQPCDLALRTFGGERVVGRVAVGLKHAGEACEQGRRLAVPAAGAPVEAHVRAGARDDPQVALEDTQARLVVSVHSGTS